MTDKLLDLPSAREALGGIARTTLFRLMADGELAIVKVGRRTMIPESSISEYIERNMATAQPKNPREQPPVKCPSCGRWFKASGMANHVRKVHSS
jgi:excisionase family DNA binding protein